MDDLSRFCCQNIDCVDYGQRGAQNLSVCDRYGKGDRLRMLYCRTCKGRFSERKGTALFNSKLDEERAMAVLAHVNEGAARGAGGRFPLAPMKCRWMRSGRSWAGSKSAATRITRRTHDWVIAGTMWRWTRCIGLC